MEAKLFTMECITNLHVGNGDVNYNIIDNEVERDPVTNYPTVNASGIKGAFREYFTGKNIDVKELFGGDGKTGQGSSTPGALKFMQADLLAMPLRATSGEQPYYLVTSQGLLDHLKEKVQMIELKDCKLEVKSLGEGTNRSAENIELDKAVNIMGKTIYVVSDEAFRKVSLPVVARNKLDNGKSSNLWYEEIVPHHSIFTFYVLAEKKEQLEQFEKQVKDQIVQFGGNATIGYGFCKISEEN